ncbi:MAG: FtsQ-type POTRA domain-containing protein [Spirochaetaceae bacterium]|jgi:cell division protein FtsQ|nr:FtsQ-type POTRA domain-containing protein [Spirochaetaceae bacterium]
MSNGYVIGSIYRPEFDGNIVPDFVQHKERKTDAADKSLKRILTLVLVVLGVELIWLFGVSPCMPLSDITVSGIPGIDESAVLALAGIGRHSSYMTVNESAAEQALLAMPAIRSAHVVKHFPNKAEIRLESRRAAAIVLLERGGEVFPALIGGDGILINMGGEGLTNGKTLPVISGLMLERVYPGMKLPRIYNSLFAQLETLAQKTPELMAAISEIRINHKNYDGYDLTLFPAHRRVRVKLSDNISEETIRYMLLMLDVLSTKSESIREIDFRTGTASYVIDLFKNPVGS